MSQTKVDDQNAQLRPPTIIISMQSSINKNKEKNDKIENPKKIKHTPPSSRISLSRNQSVPMSISSSPKRTTSNPKSGINKKQERFFYRPIKVIGKGAFGVVYCSKGRDGELVAIKKVQLNPHFKNRELDILRQLDHPNCIKLLDEFTTNESYMTSSITSLSRQLEKSGDSIPKSVNKKNELSIVMNYLPLTLHQFSMKYHKSQKQTPLIYTKLFSYQLFTGLRYLHDNLKITHRDLKPENIIIDIETGILKICDFGSAKELVPGEKSVSYIASRYYRAPELIMGCEFYSTAIDIWAAGCVIAEILTCGIPIFASQESSKQLEEIAAIIGPPKNKDLQSFQHPQVNFKVEASQESKSHHTPTRKLNRNPTSPTLTLNSYSRHSSSNSSMISLKPTTTKSVRPKLILNLPDQSKANSLMIHQSSTHKHSVDTNDISSANKSHIMRKKIEQTLSQRTTLEKSLPSNTPPDLLDLLKSIFIYNPSQRPTAEQCMQHSFFTDLLEGKLRLPNGSKLPHLELPSSPSSPSSPLIPQS